jgi:hypothetical protein
MDITSLQPHVPDMDMDIEPEADDFDMDPSFVSEYQEEIFAYKREMEVTDTICCIAVIVIIYALSSLTEFKTYFTP